MATIKHPVLGFFHRLFAPPVLLTFLPLILILLSFIFSLISISTPNWTYRLERNVDPVQQRAVETKGYLHRSLFFRCDFRETGNTTLPDGTEQTIWTEECVRANSPRDICPGTSPTGTDNVHFCEQVVFAGRMLIVGCNFLGIAALLCFGLFFVSMRRGVWRRGYLVRRQHYHDPHLEVEIDGSDTPGEFLRPSVHTSTTYLAFLLLVSILIGALGVATAQTVGGNMLVNLQWPQEVYFDPSDRVLELSNGPWLVGRGINFAVVAWVLAIFAAVVVPMVWEMPKIGVLYIKGGGNVEQSD